MKIRVTIPIPRKMVVCGVVDRYMYQVKIIAEGIQQINSFHVAVINVEITPQENWCFNVKFTQVIKTDHESSKFINKTSILSMCWKVNRDVN